jgi:hypothetical protein
VLIAFEATAGGKHYSFPNNGHLWQFSAAGKVVKYDRYRHRSDDQDGQGRMTNAKLVQGSRRPASPLADIQMEPRRSTAGAIQRARLIRALELEC